MAFDKSQVEKDTRDLEKLGYKQELFRGLGTFSNFAVSFSVISILTGLSQLYGYGLAHGGPFQLIVGWCLVGFFTLSVALSMAELASAYPTAGALYHWGSFLGGKTIGWFTGCFNSIGMFAIIAGIDYGLARFLVGLLQIADTPIHVNLLYAGLLLSHALLNYRGIKLVSWLNDFSAFYHVFVVLILIIALFAKGFSQPVSFLFKWNKTDSYHPLYSFIVGLLISQWTLAGYDASAHVTEETVDPGRRAPIGILMAVVLSIVFGFLMLVAVTLSIPDLDKITSLGDASFLEIFKLVLGETWGRAIVFLVSGAMWLCGLASMTSASRMIYAFSRDGGLPFSKILSKVDTKYQTPANAIWALSFFALLLVFFVSNLSEVVSIATIALYLSYIIPIATRLIQGLRGHKARIGPWSLGKYSTFVSVLAVIWVGFITVIFTLPPNTMAGQYMGICTLILIAMWFGFVRNKFKGAKYHEV